VSREAVTVRISGQEYRIRSDADEAELQRVARYVDDTMERIRKRTGAVDSLEVALLTALNLARDLIEARAHMDEFRPPPELRSLIERIERSVAESVPSV